MERFQSPKTPPGFMEITDDQLIKFPLFFAALWLRTHHYLKAGRALLAAASLRLRYLQKGPRRIFLDPPDALCSPKDALSLVTLARDIFAGMTFFKVHPFVQRVIEEMEAEANALLSFYLLSVHPGEEPCGLKN